MVVRIYYSQDKLLLTKISIIKRTLSFELLTMHTLTFKSPIQFSTKVSHGRWA